MRFARKTHKINYNDRKMAMNTNNAEMHFRVSVAEREKIRQLAAKAELSVSDYIRKSALKAKITPRFTDEDEEFMREVSAARADLRNFRNILGAKTKGFTPEARKEWMMYGQNFEQWSLAIGRWLERMDTYWDSHIK